MRFDKVENCEHFILSTYSAVFLSTSKKKKKKNKRKKKIKKLDSSFLETRLR